MEQYLPILAMVVLVLRSSRSRSSRRRCSRAQAAHSAKEAPYECGIVPENEPAERFPVRFYLVAMAFIVLDVEIIFLYPFTTVLNGLGTYGLVTMGVFLLVLLVPFGYLLSTGASTGAPSARSPTASRTAAAREPADPGPRRPRPAGPTRARKRRSRWVSSRCRTTS